MPALLGVRAHDFGRLPLEELADRIAAAGFSAVQLAPRKALEGLGPESPIDAKLAREIGAAFGRRGLRIAVLGSYINPLHPDPAARERELARFEADLSAAEAMGALMVGTETGSLAAPLPQPDSSRARALGLLEEALSRLLRSAEPTGLTIAIEAAFPHAAKGARELAALIESLNHPLLAAILDPCNILLEGEDPAENAAEALGLLGGKIAALHAKDLRRRGGERRIVAAFEGEIDWKPLVAFAEARDLPVLFEDGKPEALIRGRLAWEAARSSLP